METYDFTFAGRTFAKDKIKVVKCTTWIASISYEGQGWTIPLSQVSPLFAAFLEKARRKDSSSEK